MLNNLFLSTACAAVFVGTLYPLALEALTGDKISVGPPFFNLGLRAADRPLLDRRALRAAICPGSAAAIGRRRQTHAPHGRRLRRRWQPPSCC